MMDVRKWTLLHVAVNAKRLDFIPLLISAGADPHALSMASEFCVTDDLKGLAATPGDIAKLRGPQVFATYADALKEHGYEIDIIGNTSTYQGDLFWPALEEI